MTLIRPTLNYTDKDFDALRARLFNIIPSAFPDWTDFQIANFGNLLVEMTAFVGDVLMFYQDNQAQESRWSTAQLRRSLLSLLKLVPYIPPGAAASTAQLVVRLAAPPVGAVTFDVGDFFQTLDASNPLTFQVLASVTIAANADPPIALLTVENSIPAGDQFVSAGLPNQSFLLQGVPFISGSLGITADDGAYTIVEDFLGSMSTSLHAVVHVDENLRATVVFGDGVAGAIPVGTIQCAYKIGGGVVGNVAPNTIIKAVRDYTDSFGNVVSIKVANTARAAGGADALTLEALRENAPRSLQALTRTVGREDYEVNALRVPGVARALMLSRDELSSIPENQGKLYIVPAGGGFATQGLVNAVTTMLTTTYPKTITFKLSVFSATYLVVNVVTRIHLAKGITTPAAQTAVGAAVKQAVTAFFAITAADGSQNNAINFGYYLDGSIAWSDVFNAIRDTRGVRKVDDGLGNLTMNGQNDDLEVAPFLFPLLGTVTVINAATGAAL